MKTRIFIILTALVLILAACRTSPGEGVREAPEIGALAPRFTLEDTHGTEISLEDERGQTSGRLSRAAHRSHVRFASRRMAIWSCWQLTMTNPFPRCGISSRN